MTTWQEAFLHFASATAAAIGSAMAILGIAHVIDPFESTIGAVSWFGAAILVWPQRPRHGGNKA